MHRLSTYNRVRDIEAPFIRQLFSFTYLALLIIFIGGCLWLWFWQSENSWPHTIALLFITVGLFMATHIYDQHRKSRCQFCGGEISEVTRPLILTSKYLAMHGLKEGDFFYTQHKTVNSPLTKRWIKISNRSLACHHCRLTEEKKHMRFEDVSPAEMDIVHQKQA